MHLSEAYSISEVILGSSPHRHLLNKHESILLTLIPPSVSIYGSQILLYKCLKYTNAIQMKPPSALVTRVDSPRPQPVSAASPTLHSCSLRWVHPLSLLKRSIAALSRSPSRTGYIAGRSPSTFRTLLPAWALLLGAKMWRCKMSCWNPFLKKVRCIWKCVPHN